MQALQPISLLVRQGQDSAERDRLMPDPGSPGPLSPAHPGLLRDPSLLSPHPSLLFLSLPPPADHATPAGAPRARRLSSGAMAAIGGAFSAGLWQPVEPSSTLSPSAGAAPLASWPATPAAEEESFGLLPWNSPSPTAADGAKDHWRPGPEADADGALQEGGGDVPAGE
jgi:hypothetical protein